MPVDKEEIRSRSDIVQVIGGVVNLQKAGRNWRGLCPFHQEKTASFNVDPITQTFKCFGCGASGDVFTFVERHENMTFLEAAEILARRAGLEFERKNERPGARGERERLFDANSAARDFFVHSLARSAEARTYLENRGLVTETITRFQIGYAPAGWDGLTGHMASRRHDIRAAAAAGLLHPGKTSDYYDVFRHRIIFPIHDDMERIVGFGGRAFGDDVPKYLNTGETPIFQKSRLLYGLPFARRMIASEGCCLLMEGYMDVIAAHQAGFTHAVATLGTSLTTDHAVRLARLAPVVVLVYDGDNAGVKATLRASEILEAEGLSVRVVALPSGDDPDSMLRRGDTVAFQRLIDSAIGRVEYQLLRILTDVDRTTPEGLTKALRQITYVLASCGSRAERDVYMERVWHVHPMSAHGPGVAKEQMHRDAEALIARRRAEERSRRTGDPAPPPQPAPSTSAPPTAVSRAETEIMRALADPDWFRHALAVVARDDMQTDEGRLLYDVAGSLTAGSPAESDFVSALRTEASEALLTRLLQRMQESRANAVNDPLSGDFITGCVQTIRRQREHARLQTELASVGRGAELTDGDRERVRELQRLLRELKGSGRIA